MEAFDTASCTRYRWLPFAVIAGLYVGANQLLAIFLNHVHWNGSELLVLMLLGSFAMQSVLLGVWTAIGTGSLLVRGPVSFTVLTFATLAADISLRSAFVDQANAEEFILLIVSELTLYLLTAAVGGWVRRSCGLEIVNVNAFATASSAQFGIKFLLGLIAAWAVLFAVIGNTPWGNTLSHIPFAAAVNAMILLLILSPVLMLAMFVLSESKRQHRTVKIVVGIGGAFAVIVILSAVVLQGQVYRELYRESLPVAFCAVLFGAAACALASAAILRRAGYHVERRKHIYNSVGETE